MTTPTFWMTTLGCAKNQVDSEKISGLLEHAGFRGAATADDADVVLVNTCAFIDAARQESVETILQADELRNPEAKLIVVGCLAQRFGEEVRTSIPEVDAVIGIDRYPELLETVSSLAGWQPVPLERSSMDILHNVRRTAPTLPYAYLKVAEGCDKACTFCAIPGIRGKQRSRPAREIVAEAARLVAEGVRELVLVAQDLAAYGRDLQARSTIGELLDEVAGVEGIERIRLLYLYPSEIRDPLIRRIAGYEQVASYFDLSLQHADAKLLRAMGRVGGVDRYRELIDTIRSADPAAALRSSFIVGFPGETEDHVETLAGFLTEVRLDWAGFFPYSPEEGTPAALLPGRVDPTEVTDRVRYLQQIQDDITAARNADQVGRVLDVLVDQVEDGVPVGRSYREAPEIDGMITLDAGVPGEIVRARIVGSYGPDLHAEVAR